MDVPDGPAVRERTLSEGRASNVRPLSSKSLSQMRARHILQGLAIGVSNSTDPGASTNVSSSYGSGDGSSPAPLKPRALRRQSSGVTWDLGPSNQDTNGRTSNVLRSQSSIRASPASNLGSSVELSPASPPLCLRGAAHLQPSSHLPQVPCVPVGRARGVLQRRHSLGACLNKEMREPLSETDDSMKSPFRLDRRASAHSTSLKPCEQMESPSLTQMSHQPLRRVRSLGRRVSMTQHQEDSSIRDWELEREQRTDSVTLYGNEYVAHRIEMWSQQAAASKATLPPLNIFGIYCPSAPPSLQVPPLNATDTPHQNGQMWAQDSTHSSRPMAMMRPDGTQEINSRGKERQSGRVSKADTQDSKLPSSRRLSLSHIVRPASCFSSLDLKGLQEKEDVPGGTQQAKEHNFLPSLASGRSGPHDLFCGKLLKDRPAYQVQGSPED